MKWKACDDVKMSYTKLFQAIIHSGNREKQMFAWKIRKKCAINHLSEKFFLQLFSLFEKKKLNRVKEKLFSLCDAGTMEIMWKRLLYVLNPCIWIYWNEKFPSNFVAKFNWKKLICFEEKILLFLEFSSINSRVELLFFDVAKKFVAFPHFLRCMRLFCLSVWCMRRDRKVSCAPFCFHASTICRTLSQLIEITVRIIAQHHKFPVCLASPVQIETFPSFRE